MENCGNSLILRCSASENGGTSQFASRLIGEREVLRRQISRGRDRESAFFSRGARRSRSVTDHHVTETAVLASELEQLPDLCGYLKAASSRNVVEGRPHEALAMQLPDANIRSSSYLIAETASAMRAMRPSPAAFSLWLAARS